VGARVTDKDYDPDQVLVAPNKPLQRSGVDKLLGRGRGEVVLEQVMRARVLIGQWPAAERGC
jgi:hypothetical protein